MNTNTNTKKWYAVVTFGSPACHVKSYYNNRENAIATAQAAKCSGTCTNARVYECDTRKLAITADISVCRPGERIVFGS